MNSKIKETDRDRVILITGVGGFIGTHFLEYFYKYTPWRIIGLDSFRHKGTYSRLQEVPDAINDSRVRIIKHDMTAPFDEILNIRLKKYFGGIDTVINLASNSAVERSVHDPVECWNNNTQLMLNLLEWLRSFHGYPPVLYQISTDEVYGDYTEAGNGHKEWSSIVPSNPYSASKAAQEALCISYWRTYKMPIVICNTMNNVGEWQDPEKFIPMIIKKCLLDDEMPIYCDQNQECGTRVYMDAKNHAHAMYFIINNLPVNSYPVFSLPMRINVCGQVELNNLQVAKQVANLLGKDLRYKLVFSDSVRPGYDKRYLLDGSKLESFGYKTLYTWEQTLQRMIKFYTQNPEWITAYMNRK